MDANLAKDGVLDNRDHPWPPLACLAVPQIGREAQHIGNRPAGDAAKQKVVIDRRASRGSRALPNSRRRLPLLRGGDIGIRLRRCRLRRNDASRPPFTVLWLALAFRHKAQLHQGGPNGRLVATTSGAVGQHLGVLFGDAEAALVPATRARPDVVMPGAAKAERASDGLGTHLRPRRGAGVSGGDGSSCATYVAGS